MLIKCPCCGAQNSLETIVSDRAAADALALALRLPGGVGSAMLSYLSLHRPAKSALSMRRVAGLLGELLPAVEAGRIERNGQLFDAPPAAWAWAVEQMISMRDAGRLTTPLKSHGYLFEVIASGGWRADAFAADAAAIAAPAVSNVAQKTNSSTGRQLAGLSSLRAGAAQ